MSQKRVLVTGASGLVGNAVVHRLSHDGHVAIGASRNDTWAMEHHVQIDLENGAGLETLPAFDVIVHCAAALPRPAVIGDAATWGVNYHGTKRIMDWAATHGVGRFIHISSHAVYGDYRGIVHERSPLSVAAGTYAESKLLAEHVVAKYIDMIKTVILRLPTVYSDQAPDHGVIASFIRAASANEPISIIGSRASSFDFVSAHDVASAVADTILYDGKEPVFNIGSGQGTTLQALAEGVNSAFHRTSIRVVDGDHAPLLRLLDIGLAQHEFAYRPQHSIVRDIPHMIQRSSVKIAGRRTPLGGT